jgi:hypothetical protein
MKIIRFPAKKLARLADHAGAYKTAGVQEGRLLPRIYADLVVKLQLEENHRLPSACQLNCYQPFQSNYKFEKKYSLSVLLNWSQLRNSSS